MPPAIPKGLEDYLAALMERSLHDALIFSERIAKATSVMSQAGMSADAIAIALNEDLIKGGKIFGELSNSIKSGINEGVNQSGRLGQAEQYPPGDQNYSWVTVAGHKVCPDCDARTGEVKTWDEWVGEGLPGSGWSICGGHCYCVLDPVGKWESRIEGAPPAVKEPGASLPRKPSVEFIKRQSAIERAILRDTKNKIEMGVIYDKNGNMLSVQKGFKDKIKLSVGDHKALRGNIFTHNHPNSAPFSLSDILLASEYGLIEVRAIAPKSFAGRVTFYMRPKRGKVWPSVAEIREKHRRLFNEKWIAKGQKRFEKLYPEYDIKFAQYEKEGKKLIDQYKNKTIDQASYNRKAIRLRNQINRNDLAMRKKLRNFEFEDVARLQGQLADELDLVFGWSRIGT